MYEKFKDFLKRSLPLVICVRAVRSAIRNIFLNFYKAILPLDSKRRIKAYLDSHEIRKLQIGAGDHFLEGWLNTDLFPSSPRFVCLDARKPLPFNNNTFDYVFSEHAIEHLTYNQGTSILRECFRILKPGGRIRIVTPNIEVFINLYGPEKDDTQRKHMEEFIKFYMPRVTKHKDVFVINEAFRGFGHKFLYNRDVLYDAMKEVGFADITSYKVGESSEVHLQGIESRMSAAEQLEALILEGSRP